MGKHNISKIVGRTRRARGAITLAAIAAATVGGAIVGTTSSDAAPAKPGVTTHKGIPWSKVGSGWMVASLASNGGAKNTVYLVDPSGHHYADTVIPKGYSVASWSPDASRVLLNRNYTVAAELDLHTHKIHKISLQTAKGETAEILGYTRPAGRALLVEVDVPYGKDGAVHPQLERFGLDGRHQLTYPRIVKGGTGSIIPSTAVETPDGMRLVVGGAHGMALLENNGTLVRQLLPGKDCSPVVMVNSAVVEATCSNGANYDVALSGKASLRTTAGDNQGAPFGVHTSWGYSKGRLGLAFSGCGPDNLVKINADGTSSPVSVPSPSGASGRPAFFGEYKSLVEGIFINHGSCQPNRTTLFTYNAVTKHSTPLLGPGATVGSVTGADAYPTCRVD